MSWAAAAGRLPPGWLWPPAIPTTCVRLSPTSRRSVSSSLTWNHSEPLAEEIDTYRNEGIGAAWQRFSAFSGVLMRPPDETAVPRRRSWP